MSRIWWYAHRYAFFFLRFARPKSLQCSLSRHGRTVRFLLRTVRAKVINASRRKSERHFEARSIKRVLRFGKRRTNLTGVPWEWYDRDDVGVFFFEGLAWGAIIPDSRKRRRHRVLATTRDFPLRVDGRKENYSLILCQRRNLQVLPTLGRHLVKSRKKILVCGFCM